MQQVPTIASAKSGHKNYLKVVASALPKELHVNANQLYDLTTETLLVCPKA